MWSQKKKTEYMRLWRSKNRERCKAHNRKSYQKTRDSHLANKREFYKNNREEILRQHKEVIKKYRQSPVFKLASYRQMAKQRELDFLLTKDEFMSFWQRPCFYCGSEVRSIGLDRVNSDLGYTMENVVPCCILCNQAKNDLTQNEFFKMCARVVSKHPERCKEKQQCPQK
jgi:hypothetical protein